MAGDALEKVGKVGFPVLLFSEASPEAFFARIAASHQAAATSAVRA